MYIKQQNIFFILGNTIYLMGQSNLRSLHKIHYILGTCFPHHNILYHNSYIHHLPNYYELILKMENIINMSYLNLKCKLSIALDIWSIHGFFKNILFSMIGLHKSFSKFRSPSHIPIHIFHNCKDHNYCKIHNEVVCS